MPFPVRQAYAVDQGMMDNPVSKRCGRDKARLGVGDPKCPVRTRPIGVGLELALQPKQVGFQIKKEISGVDSFTFAAQDLVRGLVQVFK